MMQDVQKISSRLFFDWKNVRCFLFEVIKHFAGFTNHTYQNIIQQKMVKRNNSARTIRQMNM